MVRCHELSTDVSTMCTVVFSSFSHACSCFIHELARYTKPITQQSRALKFLFNYKFLVELKAELHACACSYVHIAAVRKNLNKESSGFSVVTLKQNVYIHTASKVRADHFQLEKLVRQDHFYS